MQSALHSIAGLFLITAGTVCWIFPAHAQVNSGDGMSANDLQIASPKSMPPSQVAQQSISPNRSDEGSCRINYVGVGGTFGLSDEGGTPLGDGGFSIVGRISLTENIYFHTSSVFGDEGLLSVALTGGAPIRDQSTGRTLFCPFLGAGIAVETEEFDTVDPQAIVGVDVPLGSTVTGTARVNTTFADDGTDVGLTIGVGIDIFDLIF
jgi:hypothetical protein